MRFGGKLDGKMNLVVRSVDPKRTLVRVNARYSVLSERADTTGDSEGQQQVLTHYFYCNP